MYYGLVDSSGLVSLPSSSLPRTIEAFKLAFLSSALLVDEVQGDGVGSLEFPGTIPSITLRADI